MDNQLKPGMFSQTAAADSRRFEFDALNEQIIRSGEHPDIVFLGDSITQMLELNAQFHRSGWYMVNRGIGGDEMRYIVRRFQADVLQLQPKYCVLLAGINDSWNMDNAPSTLNRHGESLESTLERVKGYFLDLIAQAEKTQVQMVICAVLPVSKAFEGENGVRNTYVRKLNAFLQETCREKNIPFVDYYSAIADAEGCAGEGLTYEGVHPTAEGYCRMLCKLRPVMEALGVSL